MDGRVGAIRQALDEAGHTVCHKLPEEFVTRVRVLDRRNDSEDEDEDEKRERMSRFRDQIATGKNPEKEEGSAANSGPVDLLGDLLDLGDDGDDAPSAAGGPTSPPGGGGMSDLLGGMGDLLGGPAPAAAAVPPIP